MHLVNCKVCIYEAMFLHYTKHTIKTEEWLLEGTPDPNLIKHPLSLPQIQRLSECKPTHNTASLFPAYTLTILKKNSDKAE